jgi:hypothetical protein
MIKQISNANSVFLAAVPIKLTNLRYFTAAPNTTFYGLTTAASFKSWRYITETEVIEGQSTHHEFHQLLTQHP